jgi:hypothetical protein
MHGKVFLRLGPACLPNLPSCVLPPQWSLGICPQFSLGNLYTQIERETLQRELDVYKYPLPDEIISEIFI